LGNKVIPFPSEGLFFPFWTKDSAAMRWGQLCKKKPSRKDFVPPWSKSRRCCACFPSGTAGFLFSSLYFLSMLACSFSFVEADGFTRHFALVKGKADLPFPSRSD